MEDKPIIEFKDNLVIKTQHGIGYNNGLREAIFYKTLNHSNIITCQDVKLSKNKITIIFERYIPFKKLNFLETTQFFEEMVDAIAYLDANKIIQGDLKPENVYFDQINKKYVLADFDLAVYPEKCFINRTATPFTRPPEVAEVWYHMENGDQEEMKEAEKKIIDSKGDIFSLAITTITLLTKPDWYPINLVEQRNKKIIEKIISDILPQVEKFKYYNLLVECLNFDPLKRPSATNLLKSMGLDKVYTSCLTIPRDDFKLRDIIEDSINDFIKYPGYPYKYPYSLKFPTIKLHPSIEIFTTYYSIRGTGPINLFDFAKSMGASLKISSFLCSSEYFIHPFLEGYFVLDKEFFSHEETKMPFMILEGLIDGYSGKKIAKEFIYKLEKETDIRIKEILETLDFKVLF